MNPIAKPPLLAAITLFLVLGTLFVTGAWPGWTPHVANLTAHGGFMPNGLLPVLTGAVAATGFYFGAEIVTIAAAEAREPAIAVARASERPPATPSPHGW